MNENARDFLRSVEGGGILRPPLSGSQIRKAIAFGATFYKKFDPLMHDPYFTRLPELQIQVSLGTTFRGIAGYVGYSIGDGQEPSPGFIAELNSQPMLRTHYTMQILSPHKNVNCVVLSGDNGPAPRMDYVTSEKSDDLYELNWCFRYPSNLGAFMEYEVRVHRFLSSNLSARLAYAFYDLR